MNRRRFLVTIIDDEPVSDATINEALAMAAADVFGEIVASSLNVRVSTYAPTDLVTEPGTSHMIPVSGANAAAPGPGSYTWFEFPRAPR